jgi:hypothetical protein
MAMIAMTTSSSTSVKASAEIKLRARSRAFLAGARQSVFEDFRGMGLAANLYQFRFL